VRRPGLSTVHPAPIQTSGTGSQPKQPGKHHNGTEITARTPQHLGGTYTAVSLTDRTALDTPDGPMVAYRSRPDGAPRGAVLVVQRVRTGYERKGPLSALRGSW